MSTLPSKYEMNSERLPRYALPFITFNNPSLSADDVFAQSPLSFRTEELQIASA